MKKNRSVKRQSQPKSNLTTLRQVCQLIPSHLVSKLAREHAVDKKCRTFSAWSHVVALAFAQLSRCLSLNDLCDALSLHRGKLAAIRGARPPVRNTFSHANKARDSKMAESLFWAVLNHLQTLSPKFGPQGRYMRLPRRFSRMIYAMDSTVIQLVANCMDWSKHRRRKAAIKCHMRLNLQTMLPSFAIVDTAKENDSKRARELCAHLKEGEIVVFDKAYIDFAHLSDLNEREVAWVSRAKENLQYRVKKKRPVSGKILSDEEVVLKGTKSRGAYQKVFRRIVAMVEINGKEMKMTFITNHLEWAASTVCDLYRSRWAIEVFFKQLKQTLQLSDFLGNSRGAVQWQVWIALLVYVLLRYLASVSDWSHSFSRIATLIRGALWDRFDLIGLLKSYGTAGGCYRALGHPQDTYLPGLSPESMG